MRRSFGWSRWNGAVNAADDLAFGIKKRQIANGYVILCVARAKSDCTFDIGTESHDKLYRNPFLDPLEPHELKADIATSKTEATPKEG